jgi:hypothetical protein
MAVAEEAGRWSSWLTRPPGFRPVAYTGQVVDALAVTGST